MASILPQKGRYREFYQCDADVIGSNSLLNEVELLSIYSEVFDALKIEVDIHINHRMALQGLAEICGAKDRLQDLSIALDKFEKIGWVKVKEELAVKGFIESQLTTIEEFMAKSLVRQPDILAVIENMNSFFINSIDGKKGIEDLKTIFSFFSGNKKMVLDKFLARGLNYYTGLIYEVQINPELKVNMGSIASWRSLWQSY